MSRIAAATSPGRANRRFMLMALALGLVGAIFAYMVLSRDSSPNSGGGAAANVPVVVAKSDIPARTKITQSMLEVRLVPQNAVSADVVTDPAVVVGQVTRFPISASQQVTASAIVNLAPGASAASRALSYVVPEGKRGIAINASQVQNAGGLVLPGDYVDILVIYDVVFGDDTADSFLVQTLFQNIEVLAVSQTTIDVLPDAKPGENGQIARNSEAKAEPGAATITVALSAEDAMKVYLAESNGRIRLSVRPFGDGAQQPLNLMTENDLLPQNLPKPATR